MLHRTDYPDALAPVLFSVLFKHEGVCSISGFLFAELTVLSTPFRNSGEYAQVSGTPENSQVSRRPLLVYCIRGLLA